MSEMTNDPDGARESLLVLVSGAVPLCQDDSLPDTTVQTIVTVEPSLPQIESYGISAFGVGGSGAPVASVFVGV